jgi:ribosome maturation factor RimP
LLTILNLFEVVGVSATTPLFWGFLLSKNFDNKSLQLDVVTLGYMPFFCFWRLVLAKFEQKLTELLRPAVEQTGKELLGVEYISAGRNSVLRLFIDHANGINVDDCAEVSRQVGAILDVEDPISSEYSLEVSSPGLDRPLFEQAHYQAIIGQTINIRLSIPLNGRRKFKGELVAVNDTELTLIVDGIDYVVALSNIDKGNLVAKF